MYLRRLLAFALVPAVVLSCVDRIPTAVSPVAPSFAASSLAGTIVINEVMADPNAVGDDRGEWFELHNTGASAINVQGWTIASNNDAVHTIATSVSVPAGGYAVLGIVKKNNGGATLNYAYGAGIVLANASDWLSVRDASGATVDSVAWASAMPVGAARGVSNPSADNLDVKGANWTTQTSVYGKGDNGTPGARNDGYSPPPGEITTVTVSPSSASIAVGATQQFSATAKDANGTIVSTTFTWTSANTATATVDASGLATGVAAGTAQIRATVPNGVYGEAALTVTSGGGGGGGGGGGASELVVRVLDIGQGDATYITNGTNKVFIDGGPDTARFRHLLDSLGVANTTVDVVIMSHSHLDHYSGLRELFKTARGITIRYVFENKNASTATTIAQLRDSILARESRGELIYRDADDPCGNGAAICTITMNGGAKLHVMKPNPSGSTENNRSVPVKLVGPDSASFTMWFAGDGEHEEIGWFDTGANYDVTPGMKVNVLKSDHHGSCNGVTNRYADLTNPDWVTFSLGASNTYGHIHNQTKELWRARAKPWYRTDQNGTITISSPGTAGGGYTITPSRGLATRDGSTDGNSGQTACNPIP